MKEHIITSLRVTAVLLVLVCGIYPLVVWAIGQLAFHEQVNGSLVTRNGQVIGSSLIAQSFTSDRYFHPRPSAAGNGYDASASGGSNLGPTSKKLRDRIAADASVTLSEAKDPPVLRGGSFAVSAAQDDTHRVPADAVTTSSSGLDPHISPENAFLQVTRVARVRNADEARVRSLVERSIEGRFAGIYGEPRVNVLLLNLSLDDMMKGDVAAK